MVIFAAPYKCTIKKLILKFRDRRGYSNFHDAKPSTINTLLAKQNNQTNNRINNGRGDTFSSNISFSPPLLTDPQIISTLF